MEWAELKPAIKCLAPGIICEEDHNLTRPSNGNSAREGNDVRISRIVNKFLKLLY
jgi:hypothetical protein